MILQLKNRIFRRAQQVESHPQVLPLFKPIYDRFERLDTSAKWAKWAGGTKGAINMMNLAEQDRGLMDLVSLAGTSLVHSAYPSTLYISRKGFFHYFFEVGVDGSEWEEGPHYEKDRIVEDMPHLTSEDIKRELLEMIETYSSKSFNPALLPDSSSAKIGRYISPK